MKRRTYFLSLLALLLIACAMVQPALAYFTANTQADGMVPLNFGYKTEIYEDVKDFVKTVTIQNTGEADKADPIWVRARAFAGTTYPLVPTVAEPWYDGGDGWYYYTKVLQPGEAGGAAPRAERKIGDEAGGLHGGELASEQLPHAHTDHVAAQQAAGWLIGKTDQAALRAERGLAGELENVKRTLDHGALPSRRTAPAEQLYDNCNRLRQNTQECQEKIPVFFQNFGTFLGRFHRKKS